MTCCEKDKRLERGELGEITNILESAQIIIWPNSEEMNQGIKFPRVVLKFKISDGSYKACCDGYSPSLAFL